MVRTVLGGWLASSQAEGLANAEVGAVLTLPQHARPTGGAEPVRADTGPPSHPSSPHRPRARSLNETSSYGVHCMHGKTECTGNIQQLCVAKVRRSRLLLLCFSVSSKGPRPLTPPSSLPPTPLSLLVARAHAVLARSLG